jgi:hypothetical protein
LKRINLLQDGNLKDFLENFFRICYSGRRFVDSADLPNIERPKVERLERAVARCEQEGCTVAFSFASTEEEGTTLLAPGGISTWKILLALREQEISPAPNRDVPWKYCGM